MTQENLIAWLTRPLGILLMLALLTPAQTLHAATPDVRILIDVSGSMRQNDPKNLRVPALRLVNELLPAGASAGVWLFADRVDVLVPPGPVDNAWKTMTRARLDRINSSGLFTNIEQAIGAALAGWDKTAGDADRHLVLLTDGLVDVSKEADKSAASRERIVSEQLARLKALNVKVHAIALSDKVDMELMRLLATQTGGWLETAKDAQALQRVFLHMLEQTAAPTTVPLQGNLFEIDDQVTEFTLLAFHGAGGHSQLVAPDGQRITAAKAPQGTLWRAESTHDLVTLSHPKPGKWRLEGVEDPDNRVVVVTDLGIEAGLLPSALSLGATPMIEAWLTDHQQPVARKDLLQLLSARAILAREGDQASAGTLPEATKASPEPHQPPETPTAHHEEEGQAPPQEAATDATPGEQPLALDPSTGRFGARLETATLAPGVYQLQLVIDGGTFKRQTIKRFKITGAPVSIRYERQNPSEQDPAAAIVLTLSAEPDLILPDSLLGYLLVQGPEDWTSVVEIPKSSHLPLGIKVPIQLPGEYRVKGQLMAQSLTHEAIDITPEPGLLAFDFARTEHEEKHGQAQGSDGVRISWLWLGGYLLGSNLLVAALLGLTWRVMNGASAKKTSAKRDESKRKPA